MQGYRLYFVDAKGHFTGSIEYEAITDDEAIAIAQGRRGGVAAELWDRGRRIFAFHGAATQPVGIFRYSDPEP